jgi:hypothetical protein
LNTFFRTLLSHVRFGKKLSDSLRTGLFGKAFHRVSEISKRFRARKFHRPRNPATDRAPARCFDRVWAACFSAVFCPPTIAGAGPVGRNRLVYRGLVQKAKHTHERERGGAEMPSRRPRTHTREAHTHAEGVPPSNRAFPAPLLLALSVSVHTIESSDLADFFFGMGVFDDVLSIPAHVEATKIFFRTQTRADFVFFEPKLRADCQKGVKNSEKCSFFLLQLVHGSSA